MVRHIVDLPEPDWAHDHQHLTLGDGQVDVLENVQSTEVPFRRGSVRLADGSGPLCREPAGSIWPCSVMLCLSRANALLFHCSFQT